MDITSKIYDKSNDFDFDTVIFPLFNGVAPCSTSYRVSQLALQESLVMLLTSMSNFYCLTSSTGLLVSQNCIDIGDEY